MNPKQINAYNQKSKYKKDMFCTNCNKLFSNTTNHTCYLCGKTLIEYNENVPKCPTCGSTNIKKIGTLERGMSVAAWGLLSSKLGKTMKCENCGYKW